MIQIMLPPDGVCVMGTGVDRRRVDRPAIDWRRDVDGSAVDDGRRIIDPDSLLHPTSSSFRIGRRYTPTVAGPDGAGMDGDVVAFTHPMGVPTGIGGDGEDKDQQYNQQ